MAEGGDFENENFKTDYLIDLDDDDDTTPTLQPVNAGVEQYEMQTMMNEKSGLEDISYAPFLQSSAAQEQQDIQNLGQQIKITQSRIESLKYQHSSNFEAETELKQFLKNYQSDLEKKKKELAALEKKAKNDKSLAAERDNYEKKIQNLVQKIEKTKARIVTLQESRGGNSEKELNLLKQLKKIMKKRKKN